MDLAHLAVGVLRAAAPAEKIALSLAAARAWRAGALAIGTAAPPDRPARPELPYLLAPRAVKRRRVTHGAAGRIALLHAVAHIELNAIDLAWDQAAIPTFKSFLREDLRRRKAAPQIEPAG